MEDRLISVKCLSEISLDREEGAEGNIITYLECEVYIRQENSTCAIFGEKDKAI